MLAKYVCLVLFVMEKHCKYPISVREAGQVEDYPRNLEPSAQG